MKVCAPSAVESRAGLFRQIGILAKKRVTRKVFNQAKQLAHSPAFKKHGKELFRTRRWKQLAPKIGPFLGFKYEDKKKRAIGSLINRGGRHWQRVVAYKNERACIDVKITPLILLCWKLGIKTVMSCQEYTLGKTWLHFDSYFAGRKFHAFLKKGINLINSDRTAVSRRYEGSTYRIYEKDRWVWTLRPGYPNGSWPLWLFFPLKDVPMVTRCLNLAYKKQKSR